MLNDWITEVMTVLDLEGELDEDLVLDVAREAAHRVVRPAAPITTYLLGYAAAQAGGDPTRVAELAARLNDAAARWEERGGPPTAG